MLSWIVLFRCFAGVEVPFTEVLCENIFKAAKLFLFPHEKSA